MSNQDFNNPETTRQIFSDPVAYLAEFDVEAELIAEATMPSAA